VEIHGQVTDSVTGQFIKGSEINITCWVYDMSIWQSRKVIKDTVSDAKGNFSIPFEKGEAIDIEVRHQNYRPFRYSKTLRKNTYNMQFKMQPLE
jgi:hypothetical protein